MSVSDATKHKRHQSPISLLFILKICHCSNVYKTDTSSEVSLKWQDRLIFERLRIALTSISVSGYLEIHRLIEVEKMTIIFFYLFGESYLVPVWMGLAIATLNLPFKQTVEKIFRQTPLCIGDKFIYMSLIKEKCLVIYTSVHNSIESYFRNSSELITRFEQWSKNYCHISGHLMKYSKWIVAKILVIKFISHGVRSYSASCLKQNAAFLMENLTFCAPGWREFQSSCQGRQMIWWLNQGADG